MKIVVLGFAIGLLSATAAFSEGAGCADFKWPVTREQTLFAAAPMAVSGAEIVVGQAVAVALQPLDKIAFEVAPEREPKADTFGATLNLTAPAAASVQVTLSDEAWIDVIQNGTAVKSGQFSGVKTCPGIRKSVQFSLSAGQAAIQISGAKSPELKVAVLPVE